MGTGGRCRLHHRCNVWCLYFSGCCTHGHHCRKPHELNRFGISHEDAAHTFQRRLEALRALDDISDVIVEWSCEWDDKRSNDKTIKKFLSDHPAKVSSVQMLSPRTAFRGGYSDPSSVFASSDKIAKQLSHMKGGKVQEQPGIFLDFTSQYPSVLVSPIHGPFEKQVDYTPLPTGYAKTLLGDAECLAQCTPCCTGQCQHQPRCRQTRQCSRQDPHDPCVEGVECFQTCSLHHPPADHGKVAGLAQVRILPPKSERFPILRTTLKHAITGEERNYCPLCAECAKTRTAFGSEVGTCDHSDLLRSFEDVYTLEELRYAVVVQKYKILNMRKVIYYPQCRYDLFQKILGVFAFQKIASSGFPENASTSGEKEDFARQLSRETGFVINVKDIKNAPALRLLGKICLNALIGRHSLCTLCRLCTHLYIIRQAWPMRGPTEQGYDLQSPNVD